MWGFIAFVAAQCIALIVVIIKLWSKSNVHDTQIGAMIVDIEKIKDLSEKERCALDNKLDRMNDKFDKIDDSVRKLTGVVSELVGVLKGNGYNVSRD